MTHRDRQLQHIREALEHSMRDATPEEVAAAERDLAAYAVAQHRLARVQAVLPLEPSGEHMFATVNCRRGNADPTAA